MELYLSPAGPVMELLLVLLFRFQLIIIYNKMDLGIKFFTFLFVLATVCILIVVYYLFKKKDTPGAVYLAWLGIACILWFNGFIIQINTYTLSSKFLAIKLQYLFSVPFAPVLAYLAARHFSTGKKHPRVKEIILLSVIPFISIVLLQTNEYHHLYFARTGLILYEGVLYFTKERAIWNYVQLLYSYILIGAAVVIFFCSKNNTAGIARKQSLLLLILTTIPFALNIIFAKELLTGFYYDPTPFFYSVCLVIAGINIYKYGDPPLLSAAKKLVISSMNDGIIVIDSNNRIVELNPSIKIIFKNHISTGKNIIDVFNNAGLNIELIETIKSNEVFLDNSVFEVSVISLQGISEYKAGRIISFHDITERKDNEEKLKSLNSSKDRLFSIIAHDLKNPVYGMVGISEILYDDFYTLDDNVKLDFIKDINDLSCNTHRMLVSLLDWSIHQSGRVNFTPCKLDLCSLLGRKVLEADNQASLKNIKVNLSQVEHILAYADENMIDTVIRNLISNAIKFTGNEGEINVSAEIKDDNAVIYISDNGIGISPENCQKLFKIENTYKSTGTAGERGTGLGLLLCKDFIEKNGGTISVSSKPGKGSTFCFNLPLFSKATVSV
jgi:signal transduction histidine kinase